MPSHRHGISRDDCDGGSGDHEAGAGNDTYSTYVGGGASHSHGDTGPAGGHNHTINYNAYDPYYFTLIAATKD